MSAEKGWIGEPQPAEEWHMPAWVKTGGRHFVADRQARDTSCDGKCAQDECVCPAEDLGEV